MSTSCTINFEEKLSKVLTESISPQDIVDGINAVRKSRKLRPVKINKSLVYAAKIQSKQMASRNKISHILKGSKYPTLDDRVKASNASYEHAGEVLYAGEDNPTSVISGWLHSKDHKEAILHPNITEIGAYSQPGNDGRTYVCAVVTIPYEDEEDEDENAPNINDIGAQIWDTTKEYGKQAGIQLLKKAASSDYAKEIIQSPIIQKIIGAIKNA